MSEADGVAPAAVLGQLERILASDEFVSSDRIRRFLQFIVTEALAGRSDRIKGYVIATSVFGRDETFDPQADPIVRIEAGRLRRALEHYYLTSGRDDPVRITVPKGSYVPHFEPVAVSGADTSAAPDSRAVSPSKLEQVPGPVLAERARQFPRLSGVRVVAAVAGFVTVIGLAFFAGGELRPFSSDAEDAAAVRRDIKIFVVPFEDDSVPVVHASLAPGLTRELIGRLTRFTNLFVFAPDTSFRYGVQGNDAAAVEQLGVDYILTGGLSTTDGHLRVTASLLEAQSGRYLWSDSFESSLSPAEIVSSQETIANAVARTLGEPYGIIFDEQAKGLARKSSQTFSSYECVLEFYVYWRAPQEQLFGPVRSCLERAIAAEPDYADAWAALALIYADAYRLNFNDGSMPADPLVRALELAQGAVARAPRSSRGYRALHLVYWLMQDVDQSFQAAEAGLALNPNDSELMAELGSRYSYRAMWDKGLPLLERAQAYNPGQPDAYRLPIFLRAYIDGRFEDALAEAKRIDLPDVIFTHMALAMAYGQLGDTENARAAVARIREFDAAYGEHVVADLQKRNIAPELIGVIADGLKRAGLDVRRPPASEISNREVRM